MGSFFQKPICVTSYHHAEMIFFKENVSLKAGVIFFRHGVLFEINPKPRIVSVIIQHFYKEHGFFTKKAHNIKKQHEIYLFY